MDVGPGPTTMKSFSCTCTDRGDGLLAEELAPFFGVMGRFAFAGAESFMDLRSALAFGGGVFFRRCEVGWVGSGGCGSRFGLGTMDGSGAAGAMGSGNSLWVSFFGCSTLRVPAGSSVSFRSVRVAMSG